MAAVLSRPSLSANRTLHLPVATKREFTALQSREAVRAARVSEGAPRESFMTGFDIFAIVFVALIVLT
ncbi:MAG: hypothetical protein ABI146_07500, partial [Nitrobacter sp.]